MHRAATEVIYDEGLRFIGFGNTILPEPAPGQPIDPSTGMELVEGTIRDVLGVRRADALRVRLDGVAARGRVGMILTRIVIAADLGSASAESTLYFRNGSTWDRAVWRSQNLEVGAVPPVVLTIVAADPQVQAVMKLIDSIGAGFVSPQMKEKGLIVGDNCWRSRSPGANRALRSLTGLAFDIEGKDPDRALRTTP